jgi:hypothetical protein
MKKKEYVMSEFITPEMRREVTDHIDEAIAELHGNHNEWRDVAELRALAADAAEDGSPEILELIRRRAQELVAAHRRRSMRKASGA